jgi:glycosyltransferase involved in cell wall biosynthesis
MIARTLLEFMACGRPVVTTDVGVLPEIVKGNFGMVVKAEEGALCRGVEAILNRNLRELGKAAREEAVENYSLRKLADVVNSFLT